MKRKYKKTTTKQHLNYDKKEMKEAIEYYKRKIKEDGTRETTKTENTKEN